ncbi:sugar ABC transporter ATP-binding protein [Streptomyces sp. MP131-18]|uniref:sugar ABC transporter ATP-binding protein n=1 Tax=Streptomyces sp. MP131-18 TaxID=1857892 RepID=UPI0009A23E37|nr:sugar ABC transporter ATP-binding protein [Streptomyces sp. MP131-18]ONK09218.1 Xylose import ATP-binding protein XylG [Streptomyces sp. MP131-18]
MAEHVLEMHGIGKSFPGVRALDNVDLRIRHGEIHAVCGENGAGKSTLMKILSGVHPHGTYEGQFLFEGTPCTFKDIRASERRGIVIIHQELALIPHLSIAENIFLGNERASRTGIISWPDTLRETETLMRRVGLDSEHPQTPVAGLGVGKQQLVEIAKALAKRVRLLILDEPTAALNDEDSTKLLTLITGLRDQGIPSILISHKLNEIRQIADTLTILRDGHTVETLPVRPTTGAPPTLSQDHIIRAMVGRELTHYYPQRTPYTGPDAGHTALTITNWTVRHPLDTTRRVVDSVSLTVAHGEILGLAGLMGAGRTELAMNIFGRSWGRYETGTIHIHNQPVSTRTVPDAINAGIAYVTEDRKTYGLNLIDTIARNISLAALPKTTRHHLVNTHTETATAERFRTSMNIKTPTVFEQTGRLSGGNQQKVVLSNWINTQPDILILDEPTRGIDVGAKAEIYTVINQLAAQGKAIILISSELSELLGICDRIATMTAGRLTGTLNRTEATQEALMHLMTHTPENHTTTPENHTTTTDHRQEG